MVKDLNVSTHISKRYNEELEEILSLVITMGEMVYEQVENGLTGLLNLDKRIAQKVIDHDEKVNLLEMKIDRACNHILATRQPAASDLRLIICVIKTITDIERIGDEATKLGQNAIDLINSKNEHRQFSELKHLGGEILKSLKKTIKAYKELDLHLALDVIAREEMINEEFENISRLLITKMMENPREIKNALRVTLSARALERTFDHCQNICEYIVFLIKGKDVRHRTIKMIKEELDL